MNQSLYEELWKKYALEKEEVSLSALPNVIADSWERCRDLNLQVTRENIQIISKNELAFRKKNNKNLIDSSLHYLHKLFRVFENNSIVITLTDRDCVVLEKLYDLESLNSMKGIPVEGSIHSENIIGTNSIGLTQLMKYPCEVNGFQHWLEPNQSWNCYSYPINYYNQLIGIISLSYNFVNNDVDQKLVYDMLNTIAYSIERELMQKAIIEKQNIQLTQLNNMLDYSDCCLLIIDRKGIIQQCNKLFYKVFSCGDLVEGVHVSKVIKTEIDFENIMRNNISLDNQDIACKIDSKNIHITCSTFHFNKEDIDESLVIQIRTSSNVQKIYNKVNSPSTSFTIDKIISNSVEMELPKKFAHLASTNDANVLILGETGTGKELMVQAIHNESNRKNRPFVAINCGAVSHELFRSELFGYVGGAFTGANKGGSPGKFELADGGTLFLDEIGEMPLDIQVMLLRVLQNHEIVRVGGKHPIPIDVRIIAATNKDLEESVRNSSFRDDLYFRLNVLSITLPPLRDRKVDIPILTKYFIDKYSVNFDKSQVKLSSKVISIFQNYDWPGNIRQLENVIQRALLICDGNIILPKDISIVERRKDERSFLLSNMLIENKKESLIRALKQTNGNLKMVATVLNISRGTVYNMVSRYKINVEEYRKKE